MAAFQYIAVSILTICAYYTCYFDHEAKVLQISADYNYIHPDDATRHRWGDFTVVVVPADKPL